MLWLWLRRRRFGQLLVVILLRMVVVWRGRLGASRRVSEPGVMKAQAQATAPQQQAPKFELINQQEHQLLL